MAANLCKTDLGTGSGAERYPLIAGGSHFLVVKHLTAWTHKNLIATPAVEDFAQGVTWGEETSQHSDIALPEADADARALQTRLANIRDGLTAESWYEGHKPLYAYWARAYPPYRIRIDTAINSTTLYNTMELGASWNLLRFNLYALPTGLLSNLEAWWRVWNPSCIEDLDMTPGGGAHVVRAQTYLHNGAGVMRYNFSSSIQPPKYHQGTGYGEVNLASIANESHGSDYAANSNCLHYDIYNSHNGVASTANNYYGEERIRIWASDGTGGIPSATPYYVDAPITGNGLASLKSAIKQGKSVWAHIGIPTLDAQSAEGTGSSSYLQGQSPRSTLFLYCSRIELRLRVSWDTFNDT
ncbi:MAG: hypothetical protein IJG13_07065 [Kiritimatiellae bacterium]|nr:hypothetical protein [Kiritimatiellia bacterium]